MGSCASKSAEDEVPQAVVPVLQVHASSRNSLKAATTASTVTTMAANFFIIHHTFRPGKGADFYGMMDKVGKEAVMEDLTSKSHDAGFHPHSFMPGFDREGAVFCMWEGDSGKTAADLQAFVDDPQGPMAGLMVNQVYPLLEGATPGYKSYFLSEKKFAPEAPPSTLASSFYVVQHLYRPGTADAWWEGLLKMVSDEKAMAEWSAKHNEAGFYNHSFLPVARSGTLMGYCIWEAAPGKSLADVQDFIDGPLGPANDLNNIVYQVDASTGNVALKPFFGPPGAIAKTFAAPDETRELPKTSMNIVKLGTTATVAQATLQPGWSWSSCIKPAVGTCSCQASHLGYLLEGTIVAKMDDGTETTIHAGEAYSIPPGHDGWVVGDVPAKILEFQSHTAATYAAAAAKQTAAAKEE